MRIDIKPIIQFEQTYLQYRRAASAPQGGIAWQAGSLPIIVTAPHACRHYRGAKWKNEDEYTGAITEWLHQETGCHALYLTHQINPDPHDDDDNNTFKQTLKTITQQHPIKFILDLHGVRGSRPFGVGIGTMNGITCPQQESLIIDTLERNGFPRENAFAPIEKLAVNPKGFTGGLTRPTITRFASQTLGIPAAQLELNAWIRIPQRLPHSTNAIKGNAPDFMGDWNLFRRLLTALQKTVQHLDSSQKV